MRTTPTVPAHAYSPDADRAGPDVFAPPPDWLVHILVRLILFLYQHVAGFRRRRARGLPSWWVSRPDMAPGSTQELAASVRGPFGNAIAQMCLYWGIGPGHKDWPYLSRTIVAFGGSLHGIDGRCCKQPWWESPIFVPGMVRADADTQPTRKSLLAARIAADVRSHTPPAEPVRAEPKIRRESVLSPLFWLQAFTRAGTGPPTGPPDGGNARFRFD
jgi:hypothetical protein